MAHLFFQTNISIPLDRLPVNTALVLLVDPEANLQNFRTKSCPQNVAEHYIVAMQFMEQVDKQRCRLKVDPKLNFNLLILHDI